jgi:CheY-like chemotaxis protein
VTPGTSAIRVDPAELELALINLAVNARDAMPHGGHFRISAGETTVSAGKQVWIEAADSGDGIPADVVDKVFDPFFTTKPLGKGTGLGLSQVQALCRRAGGEATLRSAPGQGTRVTMHFPASEMAPVPENTAERRELSIGKSVLLVEDNAEVAAVVIPVLEKLGCKVVHRDSADAALAWLQTSGPQVDLLLTDVVMPGGTDGVALVRAVRERYPLLKVMLMTGYAEQIEAISKMGYEVLPKPFTPRSLGEALQRVLHPPQQQQQQPDASPALSGAAFNPT